MIDDDEPSRSGTPRPVPDQDEKDSSEHNVAKDTRSRQDGEEGNGQDMAPQMELPTDVRVKLRKLEKLEGRYQGMKLSSGITDSSSLIMCRAAAFIPNGPRPGPNHRCF